MGIDLHSPSPAVLAIVGPTGSGKTALGVRVAEALHTEIISADSMQFYRHMAIGTGAPTAEERQRVRHHFVDFLEPNEDFSAGKFAELARDIVDRLNAEGKTAVVVGGSGLYVRALLGGLFSGPGKDDAVRARLHEEALVLGNDALYARLQEVDAAYASVINPNDLRRIVRALEVFELAGRPLSVLHREHREASKSLESLVVGLNHDRAALYARVEARVDQMLAAGLIEEVQHLLDLGYGADIERLRSLGYREMTACLRGECTREEAVELMKRNTRRYAKRQLSWFRREPGIEWLDASDDTDLVTEILQRLSPFSKGERGRD